MSEALIYMVTDLCSFYSLDRAWVLTVSEFYKKKKKKKKLSIDVLDSCSGKQTIHDHGYLFSMFFRKNIIQQCCLPRAQISYIR